jgi:YidC/Oxa1 family membrane protein insertase
MIGIWPLIMGVTMFVQMRLNPTPPDPTQRLIFTWMPLIFTFMLATFPAGLVIYWAWNNTLSVIQQYVIMRRQGVEVDILGNIKDTFRRPPVKPDASPTAAAAKAAPAATVKEKATSDDDEAAPVASPAGNGAKKPAPKKTPPKKTPSKSGKASGRPRNARA